MTADHHAVALARAAARACGLDASGASLLRSRVASLVVLPAAGVMARVSSPQRHFIAARMTALARAYARCGAPVVRLVAPDRQPLAFEHGTVTLWQLLDGEPATADDYELIGALVRRVHDNSRELARTAALPRLDPFADLCVWLTQLADEGFDPARLVRLRARYDELHARWTRTAPEDPLGQVVVHGDIHYANVMLTRDGPVLVDLEMGGVGPASWDFATLAAGVHRYGIPSARADAFVRGYGADARESEQLACFRDVYELVSALWAASCREMSATMACESERRLAGVLDGGNERWTLQ